MTTRKKVASAKKTAQPRIPTNDKVIFLLADDIRQELGGKLTILGYVPSNIVYVLPETAREAEREGKRMSTSFTIVFSILDGSGSVMSRIGFTAPGGSEMWGGEAAPVNLTPGVSRTMILKVIGFEFVEGEYTAHLRLNDRSYERAFRFVIGIPPRVEP